MNCCICGTTFEGYGNNPYPLCAENDYESRCCNECNNIVIRARLIGMQAKNGWHNSKSLDKNDKVVIIYSKNSKLPTDVASTGKFLSGTITDMNAIEATGDWGNFALNLSEDNYIKMED